MQNEIRSTYAPNAFSEVMLTLSVPPGHDSTQSLVTRSCAESYAAANFDEYGYALGQLFEPGVLWEICALEGREYAQEAELRGASAEPVRTLRWLFDNLRYATTLQRLNLGLALCSISRYDLASGVSASVAPERIDNRQRFELAMLDFIITNRNEAGRRALPCFERMRRAIEAGGIPPRKVADASSQAMVWFVKRRQVSPNLLEWFVRQGLDAIRACPSGTTRSSWYRAYAMLPANNKNPKGTRDAMTMARREAEVAIKESRRVYEQHAIKTYLESTLRECQQVSDDIELEKKTGIQLLKLDPNWAPSYAEVAETYIRLKDHAQAVTLLERAVELGPPYRLAHAYRLANCEQARGNLAKSVRLYREILEIDPTNTSSLVEGYRCALETGRDDLAFFEDELRTGRCPLNGKQRELITEVSCHA